MTAVLPSRARSKLGFGEMPSNKTHADALVAYVSLLEKNGSKRADLSLKDHFARLLISQLTSEPLNNSTYRTAVDAMLGSIPVEHKTRAVQVAREMFPLLASDVKAVVALMKSGGYRDFSRSAALDAGAGIKGMKSLVTASQSHVFSSQQIALQHSYEAALFDLEVDDEVMALRANLSKMLLYLTRENDVNPSNYRVVIDAMLPKINTEESRLYFVVVAREFYHFLTGDQNAQNQITMAGEPQAALAVLKSNKDWKSGG